MVIDSSAPVAILLREPDAERYARAVRAADSRLVSAVCVLETSIVLRSRKGVEGFGYLDGLFARARLAVLPFDAAQAVVARECFERFGKGRHPATLNICDCAAYALAVTSGEPLLFKGADFARTDVPAALPA